MTKTYEEVIAIWAARELANGTKPGQIDGVVITTEIENEGHHGCPTCGHGGPEAVLQVQVFFKSRKMPTKTMTYKSYSFSAVLEKLVEIATEEDES